jgi:ATP-dependent Zn protease
MAAENVFYGQNSSGVGGDLEQTTNLAAMMVGMAGMGPRPVDLNGSANKDAEAAEKQRADISKRFEKIGLKLMNRSRGGVDYHADPIASVLNDPTKRSNAAQLIGHAYVVAENFIRYNKDKVEAVADALVEKGEIYGDDLIALLDKQDFQKPTIDYTKDETWPVM